MIPVKPGFLKFSSIYGTENRSFPMFRKFKVCQKTEVVVNNEKLSLPACR